MPSIHRRRRFFSVKGSTHARLKLYAAITELPIAALVETWVHETLDQLGAPTPTSVDPRPGIVRKHHSGIREF